MPHTYKHVIVIETEKELNPTTVQFLIDDINYTTEKATNKGNYIVCTQVNQPGNTGVLNVPNATKAGDCAETQRMD